MKQLLRDYYREDYVETANERDFKIAKGFRVVNGTEKEDYFCLVDR